MKQHIRFWLKTVLIGIFSLSLFVLYLVFLPNPVQASWIDRILELIAPPPPPRTPPGRGKGTIGRGESCFLRGPIPLTALVVASKKQEMPNLPNSSDITYLGGYTTEDYPTFWFYIPYQPSQGQGSVRLMLLDEDKNQLFNQPIEFLLKETPGIVGLKLPNQDGEGKEILPLQVNRQYTWYLAVVCDLKRPSRNPNVNGWIQKVSRRAVGESAIWYDTITEMAIAYRDGKAKIERPEDWEKLLNLIGLSDISQLPQQEQLKINFVHCCTPRQ
jgi:hypothetical protein